MLKINRTSTFAWNLDNLPLLATGTVAGAVNANFDSSSTLELWDIFSATNKNEPIFSAEVETRFYALAWSKPFEGKPKGLLAGAFENGTIEFWDIAKLIKTKNLKKASVHKSTKHTAPVRSLLFNPNQPHILVSGGSKGEIFVWDTKTFSEPTSPGQAMTPMDEVTSVAWNNSVSHIFASTSNSGYTSIWDLKSKREVLHLSYTGPTGRANFSHVAWHPTQSTKLVTASDNDSCPLILTWDLRNSNAPEVILEGHKKGVLSLDWCRQDPELLISSGKDNSTLLWNPIKGLKLGEYPTTANWAFQTRFAPAAPDVFATASFDGKITIQSLQDTSPPVATKVAQGDDNEFWNEISTTDTQKPVFDIKQAPKWLVRPSSVSFGFGSKLVRVSKDADGKSIVRIDKFISRKDLTSDKLSNALNSNEFAELIKSKLDKKFVTSNDESDWNLLKKLSEEGNEKLLNQHLKVEEEVEKTSESKPDEKSETDFFENLGHDNTSESFVPEGSFSIYNDESSDADKKIIQLILKNNIDGAVDQCLKNNRFNDASILALNGSEAIKEKVRNSFFKNHKDDTLARVIYNVSSKNVTDLTANADVSNWKEIALGISSFAVDHNEFNNKITELGDRLLKESKSDTKRQDAITCYIAGKSLDKVSNIWLDELPEYEVELTKSGDDSISSPSDARFEALNNLVEKIVTYRGLSKITGELSGSSIESIAKAILEYSNLLAGYGKFELADKFLQLLPSDIAGSEKERISKASDVSAQQVKASNTKSVSQNTTTKRPAPLPKTSLPKPGYPTAIPPAIPTPSQHFAPTSSTESFTPTRTPSAPATKSTNPYARAVSSNPYAPKQPVNTYNEPAIAPPPVAPSMPPTNGSSVEKTPFKYDVEGWNDLPNTFKPKANAARRAAPVASTPSPAPLPQANLNNPVQRNNSSTMLPPPPKGVSRTSSKTSIPTQLVASPNLAHSQINSRYAPPPNAVVQPVSQPQTPLMNNGPQGLGLSTGPSTPAAPPKNPYAPPPSSQPVSNQRTSFAVPPAHQQIGTPLQSPPVTSAPPAKNPYAPQQAFSPRMPSAGIAPPPTAGMVPPPPSGFAPATGLASPPAAGIAPPTSAIAPPPAGGIVAPNSQISLPPAPTPSEVKQKYPEGDRSHIPESSLPIYTSLTNVLEEIRLKIPERYSKHAEDMEKRLSFLFDHLNNSDLLSTEAINALKDVCNALEQRDFQTASALNIDIATKFSDEIGNWHTGVKRLITMAEAMY